MEAAFFFMFFGLGFMFTGLAVFTGLSHFKTRKLQRQLLDTRIAVHHLQQQLGDLKAKLDPPVEQTETESQSNEFKQSVEQDKPVHSTEPAKTDEEAEFREIQVYPEAEPVPTSPERMEFVAEKPVSPEETPVSAEESPGDPVVSIPKEKESVLQETVSSRSRFEWELLIGGKWLNRIGAVALVIGLAFFIKYAFDHNWINEVVRVLAGGVAGILLLWGGARSHKKKLPVFGQGLIGAGIAVFYVSVFASFNFYKLISLETAFLLMSCVTILAFQQAMRYNALAVSILGWIGGFLTPFLLSSDEGSTLGLFSYLAFLTLGMLLVVVKKANWSILYYLTLMAVYLIYSVWIVGNNQPSELLLRSVFLVMFWGLFFAYEVRSSLRKGQWPIMQTIAAGFHAFLFFLNWNGLLMPKHENWMGAVLLLSGLAYLAPLPVLYRLQKLSSVAGREVMRYGITFLLLLTIACAYQWDGIHLVYAWTLEGAVLVWWGVRNRVRYVNLFAVLLYLLTALRLLLESPDLFADTASRLPVFNQGVFTYIGFALALALSAVLLGKSGEKWADFQAQSFHVGWAVLIFICLTLETTLYFDQLVRTIGPDLRESVRYSRYLVLYLMWVVYSLFVAWIGFKGRIRPMVILSWVFLGLGVASAAFWGGSYGPVEQFIPVYNLRFATIVAAAAGIYVHLRWWRRYEHGMKLRALPVILVVSMAILLFELISAEVGDYFGKQLLGANGSIAENIRFSKNLTVFLGWFAYSLLIAWFGFKYRFRSLIYIAWGALGLGVAATLFQGLVYPGIEQFVPVANLRFVTFLAAAVALFIHLEWWKRQNGGSSVRFLPFVFTAVIVILLFELVTVEVSDIFERISYLADQSDMRLLERLDNQKQMWISIVWLLYSVALMAVGIWRKMQMLRMMAIGLFGLSVIKIFLFDLSFLGTLYRIFSFIGLGVILLFVSYLYQRYKHWFNHSG
ncbi:DUF2339 domain-containing protein [Paenactinomyces guangxiensis]|uniref:DUF2339 domain-containing protein n=1 Tax=Paenactinomyces guangxiensis TaxID=1490290 RepID=A0A7W2A634_9BACL|nr:DUF2339 domain-containing protein [Paenactinomyces guangxiensis]MBA4492961.1 DUF2339 domain-containing protein [Paenactinomyces guangxiensis]MBH8590190.1 DUF2339 domain-containing protein [Paenactinomyces guangxiensis]